MNPDLSVEIYAYQDQYAKFTIIHFIHVSSYILRFKNVYLFIFSFFFPAHYLMLLLSPCLDE